MASFASLSKAATVVCSYVSVACMVAFGALFLFAWLSEEFAKSEKWKSRRKLLIALAIIGVAGEQISTLAEFAFSQHLQTLDEAEVEIVNAHSRGLFAPSEVRTLFDCLSSAKPKGTVFVVAKAFDDRSGNLAGQLRATMAFAGYNAKRQPPNTNAALSFGTVGTVIFVRDSAKPPPHFKPIIAAFECANLTLPIGTFTPTIGWLNSTDVLIGVSSGP
jgi:hypothetical protein